MERRERGRMDNLEKLKRFDEEMRKRFGVKWTTPSADPEEGQPKKPGPENSPRENPYAGLSRAQEIRVSQIQEENRRLAWGRQKRGAAGYYDPDRDKPNRKENEFMLNLMILRNALVAFGPAIRERASRAGKTTWRDIRLMTRLCEKVQEQLIATMPGHRDDYYSTYARHGHYELVMNGPIRNPRLVLIQDKYLGALCEAAMKSECLLCMRTGGEIRDCVLRQALLDVAPPTEVSDGRWPRCEYRDAAGSIIRDEEVSI